MTCPTFRPLVVACAAILLAQSPMVASAADDGAPSASRLSPMALRVWPLDTDIYLDRGRRLVVLTDNCQEPASAELASGTDGGYTEVVTSQNLRTADCPDLPSVEPALV